MSTLEWAVSMITSVSASASLMLLEHREAVAVRQLVIEQHEIDAFGVALERRLRASRPRRPDTLPA